MNTDRIAYFLAVVREGSFSAAAKNMYVSQTAISQQVRALEETLGVRLLDLLRRLYPADFAFLPPVRQDGKIFLSLLAGHRDFEDPAWDPEALLNRYDRESREFRLRKAPYEIYKKEL